MNKSKLPRILSALLTEPWLITPEMHSILTKIVTAHAFGGAAEVAQHAKATGMSLENDGPSVEVVGNIAVIPVEGVLGKKFSNVLNSSGVTSTDVLQKEIRKAVKNPAAEAIVLSFDSPGGHTSGIPECAAEIRAACAVKPVVAFADGDMNSAAYWLGSQCEEILATESADVGCIGAYIPFLDQSRMAEMAGLKVELFKSGKFKGMGYPGTTLTEEHKAMLQKEVDVVADNFKAAVRSGRRANISDELMQGQSFSVADALACGLVDSVTDLDGAMREASRLAKQKR